jgi:hypothetical protein
MAQAALISRIGAQATTTTLGGIRHLSSRFPLPSSPSLRFSRNVERVSSSHGAVKTLALFESKKPKTPAPKKVLACISPRFGSRCLLLVMVTRSSISMSRMALLCWNSYVMHPISMSRMALQCWNSYAMHPISMSRMALRCWNSYAMHPISMSRMALLCWNSYVMHPISMSRMALRCWNSYAMHPISMSRMALLCWNSYVMHPISMSRMALRCWNSYVIHPSIAECTEGWDLRDIGWNWVHQGE